jgi:hypothetical protein
MGLTGTEPGEIGRTEMDAHARGDASGETGETQREAVVRARHERR